MTEQQPPSYLQQGCYTAQADRQMWNSVVCGGGVAGSDSMVVTPGDGLQVVVSSGSAFIEGDEASDQGIYFVNNTGDVTLAVDAADPTDARIDLVVATVNDSQYSGTDDNWVLQVIAGTPGPAPTPPDVPHNSIVLAEVRVAAGASAVTVTDARDQYWLCGASFIQTGVVAVVGGSGATYAPVTFPQRFAAPPQVSLAPNRASWIPSYTQKTAAGMNVYVVNRTGSGSGTVYVDWIAVGQKAGTP